ncbi:MAG: energy-coupling factor ABC transporter ATP-binding protein [Anaerolineales bacterium]
MANTIIQIRNYTWQYLNTSEAALKNINLDIEEGWFVGVIGPNGSGKTTLAYSLDALIPGQYNGIKQGQVFVFGKEVEKYGRGELQRSVGVVFSDPEAQFTAMTVEDELVFGMENLGLSIPEIKERLEWVTDLVNLKPLLEKPPYEISGGQKQRVALAAVLAMTPKVMVLDEPTSMLDPLSRRRVFEVLQQLKKEKRNTIIVIEHSLENLIPLADRMVLLSNGELIIENETQQFFQNMPLLLENSVYPPGALMFFYQLIKEGYAQNTLPLTVNDAEKMLQDLIKNKKSHGDIQ